MSKRKAYDYVVLAIILAVLLATCGRANAEEPTACSEAAELSAEIIATPVYRFGYVDLLKRYRFWADLCEQEIEAAIDDAFKQWLNGEVADDTGN